VGIVSKITGLFFLLAVRQYHVYAIHAERIAIDTLRALASPALRRRLFVLALALLEWIEIIENVMANFFEVFGNLLRIVFFLQFLDHAVHQHGRGFLLEITHLARQLARKRERFAVDDREFLAELVVFPLEIFGCGVFEFSVLHQLRNFFDRHHLPFQNGKNLGQGNRAHLHPSQSKLLARNAPREIVHQLFLAHGEALNDPRFLPLEWLALEHLWNPPA